MKIISSFYLLIGQADKIALALSENEIDWKTHYPTVKISVWYKDEKAPLQGVRSWK